MPPLETTDRLQNALYWRFVSNNRRGQPIVTAIAVEVKVRWLNKRREVLKPDGTVVAVDVQVITNFETVVGSIMWLGTLDDIPGTSGIPLSELYQVVTSNATPDIKKRLTRYESNLMRFNDRLPTS